MTLTGPNVLISKNVPDFMCHRCAEDRLGTRGLPANATSNFAIGATKTPPGLPHVAEWTHARQALVGVRLHLPRNLQPLTHKFLQALSSDTM